MAKQGQSENFELKGVTKMRKMLELQTFLQITDVINGYC